MDTMPIVSMVGMEEVIEAMSCTLASKDLHTILICGPPGTGKSVAARGIARLALDRKLVEVPTNISVDNLLGSIDIERTVSTGKREFTESLLIRADRGIMVADNVNLMDEGVLLTILDSINDGRIASGLVDAVIDQEYDSILIGTMDPNESKMSPHIMDRFDICIFLNTIDDEEDRSRIIIRNMEYEKDRESTYAKYKRDETSLIDRIDRAKNVVVSVPSDYSRFISKICSEMNVEGHRGDVSVLNTAVSLSALHGKDIAGLDELKTAVRFCLEHRRKEPPENEEPPPEQNEEPLPQTDDDNNTDIESDTSEAHENDVDESPPSNSENNGEDENDGDGENTDSRETVHSIGNTFEVKEFVPPPTRFNRSHKSGRRERTRSKAGVGRTISYRIPVGKPRDISLIASICAAAPYQPIRDHSRVAVSLKKDDLREKVRTNNKGTKLLFVVDGSGSIGAHERMVAVKGAILSMLEDAYRKRDEVGLVIFRGDHAEYTLPMTRSVLTAYRHLQELPTGGKTPLMHGLRMGHEILIKDANAGFEPVMVILTDGRGNVGLDGGKQTSEDVTKISKLFEDSRIRTLVVDTETGFLRFGRARELSMVLGSEYMVLEDLNAERLSQSVRSAMKIFEV